MDEQSQDRKRWISMGAEGVYHGQADIQPVDGDPETALVDALANMMHWAANEPIDFDAALASATMHFEAERD